MQEEEDCKAEARRLLKWIFFQHWGKKYNYAADLFFDDYYQHNCSLHKLGSLHVAQIRLETHQRKRFVVRDVTILRTLRRQQGKEDKDNEISVAKYEMKSNLSRV